MKLELKHLIDAYKYQDEIIGCCDSWRINKISNEIVYLSNGLHENQVLISDFQIDYKIAKNPLSNLTKDIEVNGEKFVPMGKLKNGGTNLNQYRYLEWKGYSAIDNEEHETSYDEKSKSFLQFYRGDSRQCAKQLEKFEKLLEWHFDIHGLIKKGLAIDINTLQI